MDTLGKPDKFDAQAFLYSLLKMHKKKDNDAKIAEDRGKQNNWQWKAPAQVNPIWLSRDWSSCGNPFSSPPRTFQNWRPRCL